MQRPVVTAGPGIDTLGAALVAPSSAQLVRLGIEHRVQRLLDRPPDHLAEVVADPGFIDLDDLAHRSAFVLFLHGFLPPSV